MGRVRSLLGAPLGARMLGALLAVAGVALLVVGLVTLRGRPGDDGRPGAAATSQPPSPTPSPSAPSATATATATANPSPSPGGPAASPTTSPPPAPTTAPQPTAAPPPAQPRAPVTVLNNSTVAGLGQQVADDVRRKGWRVASIGNFAGRIPVSTIYFTPGNTAQERAARQFAADFPEVQRVFPRYAGLPPTPTGIVLVVTRDWLT